MPGDHEFTEDKQGNVVPAFVEDFDWSRLDTIEDEIKQGLKEGRSVVSMVRELVDMEASERLNEGIAKVLCYIADAEKPRLAAEHIAWISGMRIRQGESLPSIAKRHGMSKQAFCQAALRLAKLLNLRPARAMRSDLAKALMKSRHFKRTKYEHGNH